MFLAGTTRADSSCSSHANVHSQTRPHFCPVKGCPRSEGGKGFKRKNEMIRHGLVHQSPGYVCPFCPDREHKYPRPDNLQRLVRTDSDDRMSFLLIHLTDMFACIMSTKTRTIHNCETYSHSGPKAAVVGGEDGYADIHHLLFHCLTHIDFRLLTTDLALILPLGCNRLYAASGSTQD